MHNIHFIYTLCNTGENLFVVDFKSVKKWENFFPFLAQTMHRMRPGGVTHLHIWCWQYTGLLAVNTLGKIHYQLFLLDSDENPARQTSFTTLRPTLTQAHIPIWYQPAYLSCPSSHQTLFCSHLFTCCVQSCRLGVCGLNEINYHCVAEPHGSTSYTFLFPFRH